MMMMRLVRSLRLGGGGRRGRERQVEDFWEEGLIAFGEGALYYMNRDILG